jgi:hypothetical protein
MGLPKSGDAAAAADPGVGGRGLGRVEQAI